MPLQSKKIETEPIWHKPSIPLTDPCSGEKIKLSLRRMLFEQELQDLPETSLKALHQMLLSYRTNRHNDIYMAVLAWNRLRKHKEYWKLFRFDSEDEYLIYYDFPDGRVFASWTVMVSLFDKQTFVLIGPDALSFMIRAVGEYESPGDGRSTAYQKIFDRYCAGHTAFEKRSFYELVRHYVVETYENPLAKEAGITHMQWLKNKQTESLGKQKQLRIVKIGARRRNGPQIKENFEWKPETCPYCIAKDAVIAEFIAYAQSLEEIVASKIGNGALPDKPRALLKIFTPSTIKV